MNKEAIKKLRRKFTWAAFFSFLAVMLLMGAMIFFVNHQSNMNQIRTTLNYLTENNGDISNRTHDEKAIQEFEDQSDFDRFISDMFGTGLDSSPEFKFSTRYFSVFLSYSGDVENVITTNIAAVSDDQATKYGNTAYENGSKYGQIEQYYYQLSEADDGALIVFLDCSSQNRVSYRLMNIILTLISIGALVMFLLVRVLSKRMIMPEIKNAERQKQFITNAGHELKTPLAVIKANTELDIMLNGENEWNTSTLRQTEQMTALIRDLIMIARAEEGEREENLTNTDISAAVRETADNLTPLAIQSEKTLNSDVTEGIMMKADEGKIKQLSTLLIDNAIKYCDDNGVITVGLTTKGKNIRLTVSNDYKDGAKVDYSKFFERFYRADESHNSEKGGYGIGLSIAESIVKQYKGNISASYSNGVISFCCVLPKK